MTQKLFYKGNYLGEVSTISSMSHIWICQCCGETFAARHETTRNPNEGPLRYYTWESLCAGCAVNWLYEFSSLLPEFGRGGNTHNQFATVKAQFLYEIDLYLRYQHACKTHPAT